MSASPLPPQQPAAASSLGSLHFRDPAGSPQLHLLDAARPRVVVGRGAGCDLVIDWDEQVSREHAKLEPVGDNWLLEDDRLSRNGTYVNGERVQGSYRLRHRDRILVGRTLLTFHAARPELSRPTAVPGLPVITLTEAQRPVLRALCRPLTTNPGHAMPATNRQIAAELFLAVDTVKDHLSELFVKFRVQELPQNEKRLALARRALAAGLV